MAAEGAAPPPAAGSAPPALPRRLDRRCGAPCSGRRLSVRGSPVGGARLPPPVGRCSAPCGWLRPALGSDPRGGLRWLCRFRRYALGAAAALRPPLFPSPPPPLRSVPRRLLRSVGAARRLLPPLLAAFAAPPRIVSVGALHRSERCRQGRCRCAGTLVRHTLDRNRRPMRSVIKSL